MKKSIVKEKAPTKFELEACACEQAWLHNDSRVVSRQRDVLQYELAATEEHLNGLKAATLVVVEKKARLEAKINGLSRVLSRRQQ